MDNEQLKNNEIEKYEKKRELLKDKFIITIGGITFVSLGFCFTDLLITFAGVVLLMGAIAIHFISNKNAKS